MKRRSMLLLVAMICAIYLPALASVEDMPVALSAMFEEQNSGVSATDYVEFTTPDGVRHAFILDGWGMTGYQYRDGAWQNVSSGSVLYSGSGPRFRHHDTQAVRADGSTYPDDLGFDILGDADGVCESYHYNGKDFALCGWVDAAKYNGAVMIDGTTMAYYPFGGSGAEYSVHIGDEWSLYGWVNEYERHPATPEEARKQAALLKSEMEDDFPGYTLLSYAVYNSGTNVEAGYYRMEDGLLELKQVTYEADYGCVREDDAMPLPLSAGFLERDESEQVSLLLDFVRNGGEFQAEDVIDTQRIHVAEKIIEADAQTGGLVLLTENPSGQRKLYWVTRDDAAYQAQATGQLPEGAYLDLFHAGNGSIQLEWSDREVEFSLAKDGQWRLRWMTLHEEQGSTYYDVYYCGVKNRDDDDSLGRNKVLVGTLRGSTLFDTDFDALSHTEAELEQAIDRDRWAVVHNPDPKDRLHLRAKPKKGAQSLGKFYNGTPVYVIEELGEWCYVCIGLDGRLEGYMMTKYLTFGKQMDSVACVYPDKTLKDGHAYAHMFADAQMRRKAEQIGRAYWLVGVVEDELYVILTETGQTGYAPQEWFFDGNG